MTRHELSSIGMTVAFSAEVAACFLPPTLAHAQVNRCVDKDGNVQFSNLGCPSTTTGRTVDVRPNAIDTSGMRQQSQVELAAQQRRRQHEQTVPVQQSGVGANECPSAREIRNMEVSVSSPSLKKKERDFYEAEIRRARQCQAGEGRYSADAWRASKEALDDQRSVDAEVRRRARARAEGLHSAANPREADRIADERIAEANREAARREAASAAAAAAAARAAQSSRFITSCKSNGCTASDGQFYRSKGGDTFAGPGGICRRVGNSLNCN